MEQLTISSLIETLENIRKNHGNDVPVYYGYTTEQITKAHRVKLVYVEDEDGKPVVSAVICRH